MPPLTRRSSPIDLSRSSSNASINEIDSPTTPPGGVSVVEAPVAAFVRTLFSLVNGPYESTLVEWSPDGTKIVIRDPPRFAAEVCPKFYRHSNWNSFTRVVNMYQFRKVPSKDRGQATVEFIHPVFFRGNGDSLWKVIRKKTARPVSPASPTAAAAARKAASPKRPPRLRAPTPETPVASQPLLPTFAPTLPAIGREEAEGWRARARHLEAEVAALRAENDRLRAAAGGCRDAAAPGSAGTRKRGLSEALFGEAAPEPDTPDPVPPGSIDFLGATHGAFGAPSALDDDDLSLNSAWGACFAEPSFCVAGSTAPQKREVNPF